MGIDPGNQRAVAEAKQMAAMYRRAGFPNAQAAPEYCLDELGSDGFYTFTVSVYVGERDAASIPSGIARALRAAIGGL